MLTRMAQEAFAVDSYNNERSHRSIGIMTPAEASQCSGERDMRWISYRELAIKKSLETKITENVFPFKLYTYFSS